MATAERKPLPVSPNEVRLQNGRTQGLEYRRRAKQTTRADNHLCLYLSRGLRRTRPLTVTTDIAVLADTAVGGAVVKSTVSAHDDHDGELPPACDVASGTTVAPEKTTVTSR
jgi:hypothetical protein